MPRLVFDDFENLLEWAKKVVTPKHENYIILYTTESNELIIYPVVSTRPIFVGYYKLTSEDNAEKLIERVTKITGCKLFPIKRIEWDLQKAVGIRTGV